MRLVGGFGVLRTEGFRWHHEPPVDVLLDVVADRDLAGRDVTKALIEFAVHDLGARGIGALLILRSGAVQGPAVEERLPVPPTLRLPVVSYALPALIAIGQAVYHQRPPWTEGVLILSVFINSPRRFAITSRPGSRSTTERMYLFCSASQALVSGLEPSSSQR